MKCSNNNWYIKKRQTCLLGLFENSNWLIDELKWLDKKTRKSQPIRTLTIFVLICLLSTTALPITKPAPASLSSAIKGTVTDAEAGQSEELRAAAIPAEYIGHWKGQAKIVVNCTRRKNLPIDIEIHSNGTVEGKVGDAELVNSKLFKISWIHTEAFQHENPYRIEGDLKGEIINDENMQRDSATISFRVKDGKIDGDLTTSGTKTGSKETMILRAIDVSLIRVHGHNPQASDNLSDSTFKTVLANGLTAELVGLGSAPWESQQQWWRPDGTEINKPQFKNFNYQWPLRDPNQGGSQFKCAALFKFDKYLGKNIKVGHLRFSEKTLGTGIVFNTEVSKDGTVLAYIIFNAFVKGIQAPGTTDINLPVTTGEFKQALSCKYNPTMLNTYNVQDSWVTLHALRVDHSGQLVCDLSSKRPDTEFRLLCKLKNNETKTCTFKAGVGDMAETFVVPAKQEEVEDLILEYRLYDWGTFQNVSLKPNLKADIQNKIKQGRSKIIKKLECIEEIKLLKKDAENSDKLLEDNGMKLTYTIDSNDIADEMKQDVIKRMVKILRERLSPGTSIIAVDDDKIEITIDYPQPPKPAVCPSKSAPKN